MRLFLNFIILVVFMSSSALFSQSLDSLKWTNRILLLIDTNLESDWLNAQLKRLKSSNEELIEREVIILLLADEKVYDANKKQVAIKAEDLLEKYNLINFTGLVLIGKDGGAKLKEEFIVYPSKILNLIDSMPMRIAELKNKG